MVRRDHRQCLSQACVGDVYDAVVVAAAAVVVVGEVVEDEGEVENNQYKEIASVTSMAT